MSCACGFFVCARFTSGGCVVAVGRGFPGCPRCFLEGLRPSGLPCGFGCRATAPSDLPAVPPEGWGGSAGPPPDCRSGTLPQVARGSGLRLPSYAVAWVLAHRSLNAAAVSFRCPEAIVTVRDVRSQLGRPFDHQSLGARGGCLEGFLRSPTACLGLHDQGRPPARGRGGRGEGGGGTGVSRLVP